MVVNVHLILIVPPPPVRVERAVQPGTMNVDWTGLPRASEWPVLPAIGLYIILPHLVDLKDLDDTKYCNQKTGEPGEAAELIRTCPYQSSNCNGGQNDGDDNFFHINQFIIFGGKIRDRTGDNTRSVPLISSCSTTELSSRKGPSQRSPN